MQGSKDVHIFAALVQKWLNRYLLNMEKKHNLSESYLQSLTEQERIKEMKEWSATEWDEYYCPNGTISIDEFEALGHKIIDEEYERLGWK